MLRKLNKNGAREIEYPERWHDPDTIDKLRFIEIIFERSKGIRNFCRPGTDFDCELALSRYKLKWETEFYHGRRNWAESHWRSVAVQN